MTNDIRDAVRVFKSQVLQREQMAEEIRRLQALEDRMPKTRDGVPVTLGDTLWVRRLTTGAIMSGIVVELHGGRPGSVPWLKLDTEYPAATLTWLLSECYGSQEAVEAAEREKQ